MKILSGTFVVLVFLTLILIPRTAKGEAFANQTLDLASKIVRLQPNLNWTKAMRYAELIRSAGRKYSVQPEVLTVIVYQESSFREIATEGAAGEIGICQIRKMWLSDQRFANEFPTATLADLSNPEKSFDFAAFILSQLKAKPDKFDLPYWTKYNSGHLNPRLRYFAEISRHLIRLGGPQFVERGLAYER